MFKKFKSEKCKGTLTIIVYYAHIKKQFGIEEFFIEAKRSYIKREKIIQDGKHKIYFKSDIIRGDDKL